MIKNQNNDLPKFNRNFFNSGSAFSAIGSGSPGGKAHGLISIHNILKQNNALNTISTIKIEIPEFVVIRTDIFDAFMQSNNLFDVAYSDLTDDRIANAFQKAELPFELVGDLRSVAGQVRTPLAVRSSSLLEDAMFEPFAGIYATKMTPNNQLDVDSRFRKLVEAIKYVYASTFFKAARNYIKATRHKIEDEKMAVIIQKIAGKRYNSRFYPELSGVARSYNFYASGKAKPQDGVVNLALGLGKSIVDGGISWTYSPAYPDIGPPFGSVGEMLKQTQTEFWAVNMGKPPAYDPINETEYMMCENITTAEQDGTIRYLASTLDSNSGRVSMGISRKGARILNFAPLLQLDDIPLNSAIKELLKMCGEYFDTPVEIEFAVTFENDKACRLGFLQVRPMVVSTEEINLTEDEFESDNILLASKAVLGNGLQNSISDIVYVIPEKFEAKNTPKIAREIETVNRKLVDENRPYLLIGFGRWGSSDSWLGIPVNWGQISGAKTIVEATRQNMNIELSQGSHFFHNLTSFNISYFSVPFSGRFKIDWDWLAVQKTESQADFIRHVKLAKPLLVKVEGKSSSGIIFKTGEVKDE